MEEHLKLLEMDFKKVANDLDFAIRRLDTQSNAPGRAEPSFPNVHKLLMRIEEMHRSLPVLEKDMADIVARQQVVDARVMTDALSCHDQLLGVYNRLACSPDVDWVEEGNAVKTWMKTIPGREVVRISIPSI
ncbi:unnamed protein product [Discosporangium mesarthrocarpum]